jgi:hypothetical protein
VSERLTILGFAFASILGAHRPLCAQEPAASTDLTMVSPRAFEQPSFHLLFGDQVDLPGGTYALRQRTSAIEFVFEQPRVFGQFGLGWFYLNEGYLGPKEPHQLELTAPLHYRDGFGLQLDRWMALGNRCRLGVAAGPELYFDTTASKFRSQYEDRHGSGLVLGFTGLCRVVSGFSLELRANRSLDVASFDSTSYLVGLAYTPGGSDDRPSERGIAASAQPAYVELLVGKAQIDDFRAQIDAGFSEWIAYGDSLSGAIGYQVSLRGAQIHTLLSSKAAAVQLTAQQGFAAGRLQLYAGIGPELTHNDDHVNQTVDTKLDLLASAGVRFHLRSRLFFLLQYGRVADSSERIDTDMLLLGVGFDVGSRPD